MIATMPAIVLFTWNATTATSISFDLATKIVKRKHIVARQIKQLTFLFARSNALHLTTNIAVMIQQFRMRI